MLKQKIKTTEFETSLIYSKKFWNYLYNIGSISNMNNQKVCNSYIKDIRNKAGSKLKNHISFIDITDKEDIISFITNKNMYKICKSIKPNITEKEFYVYINNESSLYEIIPFIKNYKGVWNTYREEMKIGRFFKKLIPTISDANIEILVNQYKSVYKLRKNPIFELVKGEDIVKYYNQENYLHCSNTKIEGLGTLGKSCMRHGNNYFGIYSENPDVCNLLVLKSSDNKDKIIGRALIWKLDDGSYYMDRIYTHFDSDINLFLNYAKENGCKDTHFHNSKRSLIQYKYYSINLTKSIFDEYPYMDTFFVLSRDENILTNKQIPNIIRLRNTDGTYSRY